MVKRVHLILCVSSYHDEKTKINSKKVKNTRSQYLLRTYYILGSTLSRVSSHLILTITLGGKHCYYPHFTDGYTETQRGKATYPRSHIQGMELRCKPNLSPNKLKCFLTYTKF